jgi:hypothetical protein
VDFTRKIAQSGSPESASGTNLASFFGMILSCQTGIHDSQSNQQRTGADAV